MSWQTVVVDKLDTVRIPLGSFLVGAAVAVLGCLWLLSTVQGHLTASFVTVASAQETKETYDTKLEVLGDSLVSTQAQLVEHLETYRLDTVNQSLRSVQNQLAELDLHEAQFKPSPLSRSRRADLEQQRQLLLGYRECLTRDPNPLNSCRKPQP